MVTRLDAHDLAILEHRRILLDRDPGPRVGDFVEFADGPTRRIGYLWGSGPDRLVQTSTEGSFYLGEHGVDFSGALYPTMPASSLTDTHRIRPGAVWFFHHDLWRAHNGVTTAIGFRVYTCPLPAPH